MGIASLGQWLSLDLVSLGLRPLSHNTGYTHRLRIYGYDRVISTIRRDSILGSAAKQFTDLIQVGCAVMVRLMAYSTLASCSCAVMVRLMAYSTLA